MNRLELFLLSLFFQNQALAWESYSREWWMYAIFSILFGASWIRKVMNAKPV